MDKETLSKYGWVVIVIIVLVLLIGFTSPFGQYFYDSTMAMVESLKSATNIEQLFESNGGAAEVITNYTTAEIEANEHLYAIGATQSEYVVMAFNEDYTKVTVTKNGEDSDGVMKDFFTDDKYDGFSNVIYYSAIYQESNSGFNVEDDGGDLYYLDNILMDEDAETLIPATYHYKTLLEVDISPGVTSVGNGMFWCCYNLEKLSIADTVIEIGHQAFDGNNLKELNLPNTVRTIGHAAFAYSKSLKELVLPSSLIDMYYAFPICNSLERVDMSKSTKWNSLEDESNPCLDGSSSFSGNINLTEVVLPEGITHIPGGLFEDCTSLKNVNFPSTLTSIGTLAFQNTALETLILPSGITSIGPSAFMGNTRLTKAVLPDSLTTLGNNVFGGCTALSAVSVPDNVTEIGMNTFKNCTSLVSVNLNNVKSIGKNAFQGCASLTELNSNSTKIDKIDAYAFQGCSSLTHLIIQEIDIIGENVFENCSSLSTVLIDNLAEISANAFKGANSLNKFFLSKDITKIHNLNNSITDIYYEGTEKEFKTFLSKGDISNFSPDNFTIHYNSSYKIIKESDCCSKIVYSCSCCEDYVEENGLNNCQYNWLVTTEATCIADGIITGTCESCLKTITKTISATGHNYTGWKVTAEPTCTDTGLNTRVCVFCSNTDKQTIPATGHAFGEWITISESTCTEKGSKKQVCSVCDYVSIQSIDLAEHSLNSKYICDVCGLHAPDRTFGEAMAAEIGDVVKTIVETYNVSYYAAVLLCIDGTMSEDVIAIAQQGDAAIEKYIETTYSSEFGTDAEGNTIVDVNDYFAYMTKGTTATDLAYYIENGNWPT